MIKTADWIVDLGPEGSDAGSYIVAQGTPEEVMQVKGSCTGRFVKGMLLRWQLITLELKEVSTGDSNEARQG